MECWSDGISSIQYSITPIFRGNGSLHTTAMASLPLFFPVAKRRGVAIKIYGSRKQAICVLMLAA
jgi:hypothetical protein